MSDIWKDLLTRRMVSTNPELLTEFGPHLEYSDGSVPMVAKTSSGRMSPVRARTMKEYDQQITELKKENFSLKLRIYFLEERMQQKFGDGEDVFKTNIELKVEVESLKRELADKQELVKKASDALENISSNQQLELCQAREETEKEAQKSRKELESQLSATVQKHQQAQDQLEQARSQQQSLDEKLQQLHVEILKYKGQAEDAGQKHQGLQDTVEERDRVIDNLTGALDRISTQKEKADRKLQEEMERLKKDGERKDRDIEDELEDQKGYVAKLKRKAEEADKLCAHKDDIIGKLEDALKNKDKEKKELDNRIRQVQEDLNRQKDEELKRNKAIIALTGILRDKEKEIEALTESLFQKDKDIKQAATDLHESNMDKHKAIEKQHGELEILEQKVGSLAADQKEKECEMENLVRSLGKKDGELERFKELLNKAQEAMENSEIAVQSLQDQLEKELDQTEQQAQHYTALLADARGQLDNKEKLLQEVLKSKQSGAEDKLDLLMDKDQELRNLKNVLRDKDRDLKAANNMLLSAENAIADLETEGNMKDENVRQLSRVLEGAQKGLDVHVHNVIQDQELRNLTAALHAEKQIYVSINQQGHEFGTNSNSAGSQALERELEAVKALRSQLELGVEENQRLRNELKRQIDLDNKTLSSQDDRAAVSDLKKEVRLLQDQLEESHRWNSDLQDRLQQQQPQKRGGGVGGSDPMHRDTQTSPMQRSPTASSPPGSLRSPTDEASTSEMSAPMLRTMVTQLQQRLQTAEREKETLTKQLEMAENFRDVPGRNEDDLVTDSVQQLRHELDNMNIVLEKKENELERLNSRLNLYEHHRNVHSDGSSDSVFEQAASRLDVRDGQVKGSHSRQSKSLIPRRMAVRSASRSQSDTSVFVQPGAEQLETPDLWKQLLCESKSRIEDLEEKLRATEETVRHQTQKMKYFKGMLEENGLIPRSPSRSNSETNLSNIGAPISVRRRSSSQDGSVDGGNEINSLALSQQITVLQRELEDSKAMNSHLKDQLNSMQLSQVIENNVPDLQQVALRKELEECKKANRELQEILKSLEPTGQLVESQHAEIASLQKQLSNTRNACTQLDPWLDDLSVFLSELQDRDRDGYLSDSARSFHISELKVKLDHSREVLQSVSGMQVSDGTDSRTEDAPLESPNSPEVQLLVRNEEVKRLKEELNLKNQELDALMQDSQKPPQHPNNLELGDGPSKMCETDTDSVLSTTSSTDAATRRQVRGGNKRLSGQRKSLQRQFTGESVDSDEPLFVPDRSGHGQFNGSHYGPQASVRTNGNVHDVTVEKLRHRTASGDTDTERNQFRSEALDLGNDITLHSSPDDHDTSTHFTFDPLTTSIGHPVRYETERRGPSLSSTHRPSRCRAVSGDDRGSMVEDIHLCETSSSGVNGNGYIDWDNISTGASRQSDTDNVDGRITDQSRSQSPDTEVNMLRAKMKAMKESNRTLEDLNETLKGELDLYDQYIHSFGGQSSPNKSVLQQSVLGISLNDGDRNLLQEHLAELRALRLKLMANLGDSERLQELLECKLKNEGDGLTGSTNIHMYGQAQPDISHLEKLIHNLHQQLVEKEKIIRENEMKIEERERIISETKVRLEEGAHGKRESLEKAKNSVLEWEAKLKEEQGVLREREEKLKMFEHTFNQKEEYLQRQLQLQSENEILMKSEHQKLREMETNLNQQSVELGADQARLNELENKLRQQSSKLEQDQKILKKLEEQIKTQTDKLVEDQLKLRKGEENLQMQLGKCEDHDGQLKDREERMKVQLAGLAEERQKLTEREDNLRLQTQRLLADKREIRLEEESMRSRITSTQVTEYSEQIQRLVSKNQKNEHNLKKAAKEIRKLQKENVHLKEEMQENTDLNRTLKLELSVVEKLHGSKTATKSSHSGFNLRELLEEVRLLRIALEKCIDSNRDLREKLEESLRRCTCGPYSMKIYAKDDSPARSNTTDATDGHPCPDKPVTQVPEQDSVIDRFMSQVENRSNSLLSPMSSPNDSTASPHSDHPDTGFSSGGNTGPFSQFGSNSELSPQRAPLGIGHYPPEGLSRTSYREVQCDTQTVTSHRNEHTLTTSTSHRSTLGTDHRESHLNEYRGVYHKNERPKTSPCHTPPSDLPCVQGGESHFSHTTEHRVTSKPAPGGSTGPHGLTSHPGICGYPVVDGNILYYVYDPPSSITDLPHVKVSSDLRSLFAVGKIDDFEKLKKENEELMVVLSGVHARIKDRLKAYQGMDPLEQYKSMEYSTLRELSFSAENLMICVTQEGSLINSFWTTQLPAKNEKGEFTDVRAREENMRLQLELMSMQKKYGLLTHKMREQTAALHSTNLIKKDMADMICNQLESTHHVLTKARSNFETQAQNAGYKVKEKSTSGHQKNSVKSKDSRH